MHKGKKWFWLSNMAAYSSTLWILIFDEIIWPKMPLLIDFMLDKFITKPFPLIAHKSEWFHELSYLFSHLWQAKKKKNSNKIFPTLCDILSISSSLVILKLPAVSEHIAHRLLLYLQLCWILDSFYSLFQPRVLSLQWFYLERVTEIITLVREHIW